MKKKGHWLQLNDGWSYIEDRIYLKSTDDWHCEVYVHEMEDRELFTAKVIIAHQKYYEMSDEERAACNRVVLQKDCETLAAALMAVQEWLDNN